MPGITTVYACPLFIRAMGRTLSTRRMGVTSMTNNFPSSRAFVRVGVTRATVTIVRKTSRVSIIVGLNCFLRRGCSRLDRRVRRVGRDYHSTGLGIVLRANTLRAPRDVRGTTILTICSNTSFVGASAKGNCPKTAPRTICAVYRILGGCRSVAKGHINVGITNNIHATRRTIHCCAVIGRMLKGS